MFTIPNVYKSEFSELTAEDKIYFVIIAVSVTGLSAIALGLLATHPF